MCTTVSIDKAGRVVIPKALRERMKFSPGASLQAEVVGDKLELILAPVELALVKKGKRRVVVGGVPFDAGKRFPDRSRAAKLDVEYKLH